MSKYVTVVEGLITGKADVSHQVEVDFIPHIIAEHLCMRHVVLRLWQAMMGSWFEVVLVCMCDGFTVEVYVTCSLLTPLPRVLFATKATSFYQYCMVEKIHQTTRDLWT